MTPPPLALPLALLLAAGCPSRTPAPPPDLPHAEAAVQRGDCAAAEPELQALLDRHLAEPAPVHHYLGVCRQQAGDFPAALHHYQEALRRNPGLFESRTNLAIVLGEMDRPDDALALFVEISLAFPDEPIAFVNLGLQREAMGDIDGAVADYRTAARLAPDDPEPLGLAAEALDRAGRPDDASALLAEAAADPATPPRAAVALALALHPRGRTAEALAAARAALDRAGTPEERRAASLGVARLLRAGDDPSAAEEVLRRAEADLPEDPLVAFYLGGLLAETGRCEEAAPRLRRAAERFRAEDPASARTAEADAALAACTAPPP